MFIQTEFEGANLLKFILLWKYLWTVSGHGYRVTGCGLRVVGHGYGTRVTGQGFRDIAGRNCIG